MDDVITGGFSRAGLTRSSTGGVTRRLAAVVVALAMLCGTGLWAPQAMAMEGLGSPAADGIELGPATAAVQLPRAADPTTTSDDAEPELPVILTDSEGSGGDDDAIYLIPAASATVDDYDDESIPGAVADDDGPVTTAGSRPAPSTGPAPGTAADDADGVSVLGVSGERPDAAGSEETLPAAEDSDAWPIAWIVIAVAALLGVGTVLIVRRSVAAQG